MGGPRHRQFCGNKWIIKVLAFFYLLSMSFQPIFPLILGFSHRRYARGEEEMTITHAAPLLSLLMVAHFTAVTSWGVEGGATVRRVVYFMMGLCHTVILLDSCTLTCPGAESVLVRVLFTFYWNLAPDTNPEVPPWQGICYY